MYQNKVFTEDCSQGVACASLADLSQHFTWTSVCVTAVIHGCDPRPWSFSGPGLREQVHHEGECRPARTLGATCCSRAEAVPSSWVWLPSERTVARRPAAWVCNATASPT